MDVLSYLLQNDRKESPTWTYWLEDAVHHNREIPPEALFLLHSLLQPWVKGLSDVEGMVLGEFFL